MTRLIRVQNHSSFLIGSKVFTLLVQRKMLQHTHPFSGNFLQYIYIL